MIKNVSNPSRVLVKMSQSPKVIDENQHNIPVTEFMTSNLNDADLEENQRYVIESSN
jgi:hypothetical protein